MMKYNILVKPKTVSHFTRRRLFFWKIKLRTVLNWDCSQFFSKKPIVFKKTGKWFTCFLACCTSPQRNIAWTLNGWTAGERKTSRFGMSGFNGFPASVWVSPRGFRAFHRRDEKWQGIDFRVSSIRDRQWELAGNVQRFLPESPR